MQHLDSRVVHRVFGRTVAIMHESAEDRSMERLSPEYGLCMQRSGYLWGMNVDR